MRLRQYSYLQEAELGIGQGFKPAIIDIKTRDNKVNSRRIDYPFGSPENPMSFADVAGKFRHCCQYSVNTIPEKNQDEVIQMVKEIEKVSDVGRIVRLLT